MRKKLEKERVVKRFLFLPVIIQREWRWLEFAKIKQELCFEKKWVYKNKSWE